MRGIRKYRGGVKGLFELKKYRGGVRRRTSKGGGEVLRGGIRGELRGGVSGRVRRGVIELVRGGGKGKETGLKSS